MFAELKNNGYMELINIDILLDKILTDCIVDGSIDYLAVGCQTEEDRWQAFYEIDAYRLRDSGSARAEVASLLSISHKLDIDIATDIANKVFGVNYKPIILPKKIKERQVVELISKEIIRQINNSTYGIKCKSGSIFIYTGKNWRVISDIRVFEQWLVRFADKIGGKFIESRDGKFIDALYYTFSKYVEDLKEMMVGDFAMINFLNGTLHLEYNDGKFKKKLKPHSKNDNICYILPYDYEPRNVHNKWQYFLDEVLPDKQLQSIVQEYAGYIFCNRKLEKSLGLIGTGANGKSVFCDVMSAMVGRENTSTQTITNLTDDRGYYIKSIVSKLVNISTEAGEIKNIDILKNIISRESVTGREPAGKQFTVAPNDIPKLIFCMNTYPKNVELSGGFERRFLFVKFGVTIPPGGRDVDLSRKLSALKLLPGIMNWALEGLERLIFNNKFTDSEVAQNLKTEIMTEGDSILNFIEHQNIEKSDDSWVSLVKIYGYYMSYCRLNGYEKTMKNNKELAKYFREKGYNLVRKKSRESPSGGLAVYCSYTPPFTEEGKDTNIEPEDDVDMSGYSGQSNMF